MPFPEGKSVSELKQQAYQGGWIKGPFAGAVRGGVRCGEGVRGQGQGTDGRCLRGEAQPLGVGSLRKTMWGRASPCLLDRLCHSELSAWGGDP